MEHYLNLKLNKHSSPNLSATITCVDHDECEAALRIREGNEEYQNSHSPDWLNWYEGEDMIALSGKINLKLSEEYVTWSYCDSESKTDYEFNSLGSIHPSSYYYKPLFSQDLGIQHVVYSCVTGRPDLMVEQDEMELYYGGDGEYFGDGYIAFTTVRRVFGEYDEEYWDYRKVETIED